MLDSARPVLLLVWGFSEREEEMGHAGGAQRQEQRYQAVLAVVQDGWSSRWSSSAPPTTGP